MNDFIQHLKEKEHKAENTILAYKRDLKAFEDFLRSQRNGKALCDAGESDAVAYIMQLDMEHKSARTINRKASAMRAYYDYMISKGFRRDNPFEKKKSTHSDKRVIDFLTVEEVFELLEQPDEGDKGLRDRAMMEFMYGTGARVTELVRLKFKDLNLRMNFATLKDVNSESRIVPLGSYAGEALRNYLRRAYPNYSGKTPEPEDYVFVNRLGACLTRQGIWKILKEYGARIGIEERMTPGILRDSFAVHILQNGGDLKTLQELMGFDDMSIGIAYLEVTDIRIRDVFTRCHPRA